MNKEEKKEYSKNIRAKALERSLSERMLYTTRDIAIALGCDESYVLKLRSNGLIKGHELSNGYRYTIEEFDKFVEEYASRWDIANDAQMKRAYSKV